MSTLYPTNVASSTPFDNDTNGFASEDVQAAIEEAKDNGPGYHSGWDRIEVAQEVEVLIRRQMRVISGIYIEGTLIINGTLALD